MENIDRVTFKRQYQKELKKNKEREKQLLNELARNKIKIEAGLKELNDGIKTLGNELDRIENEINSIKTELKEIKNEN